MCAVLRMAFMFDANDIAVGPWRASTRVGSAQADAFLRAAVALNGLLALNHEETIYFTATADDAGHALSGRCRYRVVGRDPDTRWWSLTVYGADRFLVPNPAHRYSATRNTVSRDSAGVYTIRLGGTAQPGDWIALPAGRFILTLRAYNPGPALAARPREAQLPAIVAERCA